MTIHEPINLIHITHRLNSSAHTDQNKYINGQKKLVLSPCRLQVTWINPQTLARIPNSNVIILISC
jgi:hypothetical protein